MVKVFIQYSALYLPREGLTSSLFLSPSLFYYLQLLPLKPIPTCRAPSKFRCSRKQPQQQQRRQQHCLCGTRRSDSQARPAREAVSRAAPPRRGRQPCPLAGQAATETELRLLLNAIIIIIFLFYCFTKWFPIYIPLFFSVALKRN